MGLSRRQFLKNTTIGAAGLIGGAGLLKQSAFAAYPAPATSYVAFIGGSSSYTGGHKQMIKDLMVPFTSNIQAAIAAGKKIILKPNCVGTGNNDSDTYPLACTSYYALAGLIEFIQGINATYPIAICEAGASLTTTMFSSSNYPALLTAYGSTVSLIDLNTNKTYAGTTSAYPPITRHLWHYDLSTTVAIYAAPIYLDPNAYIISVCRPKTHNNVVITCTTKNCGMGMPLITIPASYTSKRTSGGTVSSSKQAMHDGAPGGTYTGEDKCLEWNIFQNASHFVPLGHPDLAICDAWEGMQGQGPTSGTSVMQYCMVAGTDNLAVDRLAVKLVGLSDTENLSQPVPVVTPSYSDCRYLLWMSNAGYGNYNLNKISFLSGFPNAGTLATLNTYVKTYTLHTNYTSSSAYETLWELNDTLGPGSGFMDQVATKDTSFSYPMPFMMPQSEVISGNEVKIDLALPAGFPIQLDIFNLQNQKVRSLASEYLASGRYSMLWDCKANDSSVVPNGNYIIKLQFGSRAMVDRISLMR